MTQTAQPVEMHTAPSGQRRIFQILELSSQSDRAGRIVSIFLATLIGINVLLTVLETVPSIHSSYGPLLYGFELASVAVFIVEYVLRIWTSTADPRYPGAVSGRVRYALTPLALIDLLAILPALLPFLGVDLRMLRVLRLLRVLKLSRHSEGLRLMQTVVTGKRRELAVGLLLLGVLLVMSASLMYYLENEAQPHLFPHIPAAMWWSIVTLTTVGYGDIYPVTTAGRILGGITVVVGVAVVAIPAAVFASGFMEELQKRAAGETEKGCPHCGKLAHEPPAPRDEETALQR